MVLLSALVERFSVSSMPDLKKSNIPLMSESDQQLEFITTLLSSEETSREAEQDDLFYL